VGGTGLEPVTPSLSSLGFPTQRCAFRLVRASPRASRLISTTVAVMVGIVTTERLVYGLVAMIALLIVGTTVGLIWADTSDVAGAFAGVTNVIGIVGIVAILIALAVRRRRRSS
jgi:hypothetical protein